MRLEVSVLLTVGAMLVLQALIPVASLAADGEAPAGPLREDRWVPSLAITSGVTVQNQKGFVDSDLFKGTDPVPQFLQGTFDGDDLAASPFVGGSLEVMTPALPIPTRPRFFLSGEILPTFASDRDLALDGDPGCIRGPEPETPCAREEDGSRRRAFGQDAVNGEGSSTIATVDTLVFGASTGVAFPFSIAGRQLRLKPSVGWISYEVQAEGLVVDAKCSPVTRCTVVTPFVGATPLPGFLRETTLTGGASQRFNGLGPGLDIELDAGRLGPLGVSLFLGARAYRVLGDRTISFDASQSYSDLISGPGMTDVATAAWEVDVDPWMYRAHVGIRFQWLGSGN